VGADARYDLFVIGGGPAGYTAALLGVRKGLTVGIAEAAGWGGTCTNRGCIPTKTYIDILRTRACYERAARSGVWGSPGEAVNLGALRRRTLRIVGRLSKGIEYLLERSGVGIHRGRARLDGGRAVSVGRERIEAGAILVATGSSPRRAAQLDAQGVITSDDVFDLTDVPSPVVVAGAGAMGMEMAHIFSCLGADVTVIEEQDRILPSLDEEVSRFVENHYRSVRFMTGARILAITPRGPRLSLEVADRAGAVAVEAQACVSCVGRVPVLPEGVREAGIELGETGGILVDARMHTSAEGVYAAGDVTGSHMYAYVAAREAEVAVSHITGDTPRTMDYSTVPVVVFLDPEIASVGTTSHRSRTGAFPVSALGRARAMEISEGFARVSCRPDGVVEGVLIVAPHAAELVSWASLAVHAHLDVEEFLSPLCPHPTMAELLKEAAEDVLGLCLHKP